MPARMDGDDTRLRIAIEVQPVNMVLSVGWVLFEYGWPNVQRLGDRFRLPPGATGSVNSQSADEESHCQRIRQNPAMTGSGS